jgi:hypothetical protein
MHKNKIIVDQRLKLTRLTIVERKFVSKRKRERAGSGNWREKWNASKEAEMVDVN